ncbi:MAG TPA: hypothetical protein VLH18_07015 [Candidatus Limnocylindrales bacterium]|nr:hypothetical protein [Candidatus Limnocylindrales bacterium]
MGNSEAAAFEPVTAMTSSGHFLGGKTRRLTAFFASLPASLAMMSAKCARSTADCGG